MAEKRSEQNCNRVSRQMINMYREQDQYIRDMGISMQDLALEVPEDKEEQRAALHPKPKMIKRRKTTHHASGHYFQLAYLIRNEMK